MQEGEQSSGKQVSEAAEGPQPEKAKKTQAIQANQGHGETKLDKYEELLARLGLSGGTATPAGRAIQVEERVAGSGQKISPEVGSKASRGLDLNETFVRLAKSQVTVIIPTFNEAEGIAQLLDEVMSEGYGKILVVDGYSSDKTVELAHQKGVPILYQHGPGKAGAVMTAIEHVETPYMLFIDGDCTYDPKDIWRLLNHADRYSQVIGARDKRAIPKVHRFGNWIISQTFSLLFGVNLTDVCSGMYLLETERARAYRLRERGFVVEIELAASSATDDNVTEVPISYRPRVGKGKLKAWHGLPILFAAFTLFRRYNPIFLYSALGSLSLLPATVILSWVMLQWLAPHRVWHSGWAIVGVLMALAALQSLTVASISILTRHSEERLLHQMKRIRGASS